MTYVQSVGQNKTAGYSLKSLLLIACIAYFAVLIFSLILTKYSLVFRLELLLPPEFKLHLVFLAPAVLFATLVLLLKHTWAGWLCWFVFIVTGICALGLSILSFMFFVSHTENHCFSHDRLVQISVGDQGALGDGPTSLAVGQAWGPLFYKMRNTPVDKVLTVGKETNGKVKLEYSVNSMTQVRDLDELLAGKPF